MERLLLRPAEAAELLGISRSKTYEMLAAGELPCVRIRSSIRVPHQALVRWIEDQAVVGQGENRITSNSEADREHHASLRTIHGR